eukprot:15454786-Alexandrium_andersonii.AAC.1
MGERQPQLWTPHRLTSARGLNSEWKRLLPRQARRAIRPCPVLGIGAKSATPSLSALGAGDAVRRAAPLARSPETS